METRRSPRAREAAVIPLRLLAATLGAQYVAAAALGVVWLALPRRSEDGSAVVLATAALALLAGLAVLEAARRDAVPAWLPHAAVAAATPLIGVAVHATGDPDSPLLFFTMWTVLYVGLFGRRAAAAHLGWSALVVGVALAGVPAADRALSPGSFVLTVSTSVVVATSGHRLTARLQHEAQHDPLTGLPNRAYFLATTSDALARRCGPRGTVAVLLVDLDRFKVVNDTYGHHAGDALLCAIAPRLLASVRPGDTVARLGGDEFAVLCVDPSGALEPERLALRLAQVWREPLHLPDGTVYTSGSVGVAVASRGDETPESLLRDADAAMYQAKARGPGEVSVYDAAMRAGSESRLRLERALREALDRDEFHLAHQPVVRLGDGCVVGTEALLRWTHPGLGAVAPGDFIPLAEETGLVVPLGAWVLERAVADLADWRRDGVVGSAFTVAVNVSARQLTPELPRLVQRVLSAYGVPAASLGLEITESALLPPRSAAPVLEELRGLGVTLLLDDFGTGFSSLSHLRQFRFHVLKIDRSFVAGLCDVPRQRSIVMAILSMAEALGLDVVAEGSRHRSRPGCSGPRAAAGGRAGCSVGPSRPDGSRRRWPRPSPGRARRARDPSPTPYPRRPRPRRGSRWARGWRAPDPVGPPPPSAGRSLPAQARRGGIGAAGAAAPARGPRTRRVDGAGPGVGDPGGGGARPGGPDGAPRASEPRAR